MTCYHLHKLCSHILLSGYLQHSTWMFYYQVSMFLKLLYWDLLYLAFFTTQQPEYQAMFCFCLNYCNQCLFQTSWSLYNNQESLPWFIPLCPDSLHVSLLAPKITSVCLCVYWSLCLTILLLQLSAEFISWISSDLSSVVNKSFFDMSQLF